MRVLIADDHPLYRDGLARAVSARFELVARTSRISMPWLGPLTAFVVANLLIL